MTQSVPSDSRAEDVARALERASERLRSIDDVQPFSNQAFDLLQQATSEYVSELIAESAKLADRQRADIVSAADVRRASEYLYRAPTRSLQQHIGTSGGILLGAGLGNTLSLLQATDPSGLSIAITVVLVVLGAFMIAWHMGRDLR